MALSTATAATVPDHGLVPGADASAERLVAILDALALGVLAVDAELHVLLANGAARRILAARDALCDERGVLRPVRPVSEHPIRRQLTRAVAERVSTGVLVPRTSGGDALVVVAVPLPASDGRPPTSVLFVTDPAAESPGIERIVRALFGVTRREAAVTAMLAGGHAVEELAARLGITRNTAWTHLKRVFSKAGTRGQSDLVRRLAAAVCPIRLA